MMVPNWPQIWGLAEARTDYSGMLDFAKTKDVAHPFHAT
jgi:hypothetical protein